LHVALVALATTVGVSNDELRVDVDDWGGHGRFQSGQETSDNDLVEKHLGKSQEVE
jgi:hypothetical protein